MTQALPAGGRPQPFTVTTLAARMAQLLDREIGSVWVRGEVGGLTSPRSGHVYFNLKDSQSQLRCVMFASAIRTLRFKLTEGSEILMRGRPGVYSARGDLQIIVDYAEPVGLGSLQAEFERLKRKLHAEGLFDAARKRPLPFLPRLIAVVTSPTGAAIRDVLTVLRRRNPALRVRIVPAAVQGAGAGVELARAVQLADRHARADLILLTRGGGSAEDLAAFNDETLARAIAASKTPVVSAVGHEVDFTIADFVADLRAPTPSAAAETITPVRSELLLSLAGLRGRLDHSVHAFLGRRHQLLVEVGQRLEHRSPRRRIADGLLRLDELEHRLDRAVRSQLRAQKVRLQQLRRALLVPRLRSHLERIRAARTALHGSLTRAMERRLAALRHVLDSARTALEAMNPLDILQRGFSIARKNGEVLTDANQVAPGDPIEVQLARGTVYTVVERVQAARGD